MAGNARRIAMVLVALTLWAPASAHAGTITAPYGADEESTRCDASGAATCSNTAAAEAAAGTVDLASTLTAPQLSDGSGLAQSSGSVTSMVRTPRKARSVQITATVRVRSASASLAGTTHSVSDRARSTLNVTFFVWCAGCANGWATVDASVLLADTDPATSAPPSVTEETKVVTVRHTLQPGQHYDGNGSATVSAATQGFLGHTLVALERRASASTSLTVVRIESVES